MLLLPKCPGLVWMTSSMVSLVLVTLYAYLSLDLMPLFIISSPDTRCHMMSLAFSTPLRWHLLMPKCLQNCTGSCRCCRYPSDHCDTLHSSLGFSANSVTIPWWPLRTEWFYFGDDLSHLFGCDFWHLFLSSMYS